MPRGGVITIKAKNISSTPWLGDMDDDNQLDLVYCLQVNTSRKMHEFLGFRILRLETAYPFLDQKNWKEYMGKNSRSIFD